MGAHTGIAVTAMPDGGAVVTGEVIGVANMRDIVTIRYSPTGSPVWTNFYNGATSGNDVGNRVVADNLGNVYVCGYTQFELSENSVHVVTLKYASDGALLWERTMEIGDGGLVSDTVQAMALDNAGNLVIMGTSNDNAWYHKTFVRKYDPEGTLLWHRDYIYQNYFAFGNMPQAMAINKIDEIFIAGGVQINGFDWEMLILKYLPNGNRRWIRFYDSPWGGDDYATAIAADSSGGVYITGPSEGATGSVDYITMKYDSLGVRLWDRRHIGPANGTDYPIGIGVDDAGAIYVGGRSKSFFTLDDYHIIKYDTMSIPVWERYYTGPGFCIEIPQAFRVDKSGTVYIAVVSGPSPSAWEYATVSFDSSGQILWTRRYGANDGIPDSATAMHLDTDGNVFLTGKGNVGTLGEAITTVKYAPCSPPAPLAAAPSTSNDSPCGGTSYSVSWSASPGATGYELYENEAFISTGPDTVRSLSRSSGSFTYTVRVVHSACGKSAHSPSGAVTNVTACTCHGDPSCDGVTNVVDVTTIINEAFRGQASASSSCPGMIRSDVDCDCAVTITDVVRIINVAFRGVNAATEFCNACVSQCP
jgi:hypothetical protein